MSESEKFEARRDKIVRTLGRMFDYLGLSGALRVEEKSNKIVVKIISDDAGRIIGRKGQTLESLQLLLNRIMFKVDPDIPHILLDIDGYAKDDRELRGSQATGGEDGQTDGNGGYHHTRQPREPRGVHGRRDRRRSSDRNNEHISVEQLERQALDAAKEVRRWGEPVKLPELNAHDRRIIHLTLKNEPDIVTESEGDGLLKKVVISLKNS